MDGAATAGPSFGRYLELPRLLDDHLCGLSEARVHHYTVSCHVCHQLQVKPLFTLVIDYWARLLLAQRVYCNLWLLAG